jgi:hypothetical protein
LNLTAVAAAFEALDDENVFVVIAEVRVYDVEDEVEFLYIAIVTAWFCAPLVPYVGVELQTDLLIAHTPMAYLCMDEYQSVPLTYAPPSTTMYAMIGYPLPVYGSVIELAPAVVGVVNVP